MAVRKETVAQRVDVCATEQRDKQRTKGVRWKRRHCHIHPIPISQREARGRSPVISSWDRHCPTTMRHIFLSLLAWPNCFILRITMPSRGVSSAAPSLASQSCCKIWAAVQRLLMS